MKSWSIGILLITVLFTNVICENLRISVKNNWLVDTFGRIRIFHGFNSVQKSFPWYDKQILNETRLKLFQEWGFNSVRLGMMWKGLEPQRGQYNETYLNTIDQAVQLLKSHGIYTLLDAHQDVFSSAPSVCSTTICYEGIPNWVSSNFTHPTFSFPWPFRSLSPKQWALGYLTYSVSSAFQQFYDNIDGVLEQFGKFWKKVATRFHAETSILGYELINEPWTGNFYNEPEKLLPGVAGMELLLPMYDYLFQQISTIDNHTNIFYEPVTWAVYSNFRSFRPGFNRLPGGAGSEHRAVLSFHYYCWPLQNLDMTATYPFYLRILCDHVFGSRLFPVVLQDVEVLRGSLFLTEFGLCAPDGNEASMNTIECNFVLHQADKYLQSWMYWDSSFFLPSGAVNLPVVEAFARPYPQATSGIPQQIDFDSFTKVFTFTFLNNPSIQAPTELFIPKLHYPSDLNVIIEPADVIFHHNATSSILYIQNIPIQINVSITIQPK